MTVTRSVKFSDRLNKWVARVSVKAGIDIERCVYCYWPRENNAQLWVYKQAEVFRADPGGKIVYEM